MRLPNSLFPAHQLLSEARKHKYAIPAFNIENFDALIGILDGSSANRAPLIIQATQPAIENLGIHNLVAIVSKESRARNLPVALHLDHGESISFIVHCLEAGFSSVMFDGSRLPLSENIQISQEVVRHAKSFKASVEVAIGGIGSDEAPVLTGMAGWEDAKLLLESSGADVLAVAIGSIHGMRSREIHLDFDVLRSVAESVAAPLVLHGSSGVCEDDLKVAVGLGVAKVNLETELRVLFRSSLEKLLRENPNEIKPRNIMRAVRNAIQDRTVEYQTLLGAAGKADTWGG